MLAAAMCGLRPHHAAQRTIPNLFRCRSEISLLLDSSCPDLSQKNPFTTWNHSWVTLICSNTASFHFWNRLEIWMQPLLRQKYLFWKEEYRNLDIYRNANIYHGIVQQSVKGMNHPGNILKPQWLFGISPAWIATSGLGCFFFLMHTKGTWLLFRASEFFLKY